MGENRSIPQHVAIIMDGNGRWAKARGLERTEGHMQGIESVRKVIRAAASRNVRYLTLYAFSTENWGRPAEEVETLMELICTCIVNETPELIRQGVRVLMIGDHEGLSPKVRQHIASIEERTAGGERLTLMLAINYSSRSEITAAVRRLTSAAAGGELNPGDITADTIAANLYTAGIPDPDLIVRTSGECRLSNFLMWQAAYSELYFTDVLWPDFDREEFDKALDAYARRDRRYGLITK